MITSVNFMVKIKSLSQICRFFGCTMTSLDREIQKDSNKTEAVSLETASNRGSHQSIKATKYQIPNLYPKVRVNIFLAVLKFATAGSTFISTGYKKYF
jgi:hypothetical protein